MSSPRLHPDTIEEVKDKTDIVDVVSEYVVLKKQGKDLTGLCPFHDDKSPSFSVSPSKQFYYCFSCGAAGNAFKFLMELNKQSFGDVVLQLARKYQVPVKTLEPEQRQEFQRQLSVREQLYEILSLTARFYEHALHQTQGRDALEYLLVKRKLSEATIQQFQLGYAPAGWETLYGYLVEQKHYPVELVEKAGLILPRKSGDSYYDRFRHRLMIPIHDIQGRVIGFGGRALGDEQPKYLNSPETELFDKGKTLFALDRARSAIAKQDQAIVVEGYFDAIALHAAGVDNVVASLGTALSANQVKLLLRYTESKQVVFNFDADAAGVKAAERAIGEVAELAYQGQVQLRILNIPDGKDPDEFLRSRSSDDYRELLVQAPLWLDWQIQQTLIGRDLKQADQFQQVIQELVKLLGNLPNTPVRTHYIHHCAELLSQGDARIMLRFEEDLRTQVKGQRWHGRSQKWEKPGDYTLKEAAEAQLLKIYIHCPDYREAIHQGLEKSDVEFGLSHHRFLWRQILELVEQEDRSALPEIDLLAILRHRFVDFPKEMSHVLHLLELDELSQLDIKRPEVNIAKSIASLERIVCEKRRRHILSMWQNYSIKSIEDFLSEKLQAGETVEQPAEPEGEATAVENLYRELNAEAFHFQKLLYDEQRYLEDIERRRLTDSSEYVL